tara:strand:+ start:392 stop:1330 length:939 start_codon:yes stop_codon:yes gene_type:complete
LKKLVSIVIPVYNEIETINEMIVNTINIASCWKYDYELIIVNDGSADGSREIIEKLCTKDMNIKLINLSRNFGHQLAFTAGLDFSNGSSVIVIDGDLQDPPIVMNDFIKKWEFGYDIVYGKRLKRSGESFFKLLTSKFFYIILDKFSDVDIPRDVGDFRLMDRKVVDKINTMRERHRFIRGMIPWLGFKETFVEYDRDSRFAGQTKFSFNKMVKFALDGIFSFSIVPIKYTIILGIFTVILSLGGIIYAFIARLITDGWVSGWTTLIITMLFIGGVQLISIGVLGQYIGRIFEEAKNRPLYIVESTLNIEKK